MANRISSCPILSYANISIIVLAPNSHTPHAHKCDQRFINTSSH